MPTNRIWIVLAVSAVLSAAACKDDKVVEYRVSKPAPEPSMPASAPSAPLPPGHPPISAGSSNPMQAMAGMVAPAAAPSGVISWTLPRGWAQKAPSEMRTGSFSVAGKDGLSADISIVVLGGDAGGDLANVNRWRGQLNLEPITQDQLPRYVRKIAPGGRPMLLVDLVTTELYIDNRYRKRLVAAVYPRGGRTWFFKMTGEDQLVRSIQPTFLKFLSGLKFNDGAGA